MFFSRALALGIMLSIAAASHIPDLFSRQNVNPGPVSGATFIHDPTVVKTPGGSYIAAYTGDNIQLKQSSDRTVWRDVGAAFPNGASVCIDLLEVSSRKACLQRQD